MSVSYKQLIADLKETTGGASIVSRFYELLFNKNVKYHINGYTLISMTPPHLSGIGRSPESFTMNGIGDNILFAVDFQGIDISINTSSTQGYITYPTKKSSDGQISCSYLDSSNLHIYSFHKLWVDYIDAVRKGVLEPSGNYISEKELDFVGSMYAMVFEPDMITPVYTAKAIGIFPVSLGDKEIIGARTDNSIATYSVSYYCSGYGGQVGGGSLYSEFMNSLGT